MKPQALGIQHSAQKTGARHSAFSFRLKAKAKATSEDKGVSGFKFRVSTAKPRTAVGEQERRFEFQVSGFNTNGNTFSPLRHRGHGGQGTGDRTQQLSALSFQPSG